MTKLNSIMEEGPKNVMLYGTRKEFKRPVIRDIIELVCPNTHDSGNLRDLRREGGTLAIVVRLVT